MTRFSWARKGCRNYLSSTYKCNQAWEERLSSATLKKVDLEQFYAEVETKHQQTKKISAIDVDLIVNKVSGDGYFEEMADLVHKLRMTDEASKIIDSTPHAVVRNFLEHDQIDLLLHVLRDPLNYGIFLDTFCTNLALDKLVEEKRFIEAAEIASFLMLQEDFGDDMTKSLSLLALYNYLENPQPFIKPEPAPEPTKVAPATPTKGKKAKKEENRVRVKFLRNDYFDDHFDLRDPRHLVGKTLVRLGYELPRQYQPSVQLLGLSLYQKYEEALEMIGKLKKGDKLYKDLLAKTKQVLEETVHESEEYKNLLEKVQGIAENENVVLIDDNFQNNVVDWLKSSIDKFQTVSISDQEQVCTKYFLVKICIIKSPFIQTYKLWLSVRDEKLQDELLRLKRAAALKEFEKKAKELEMEEKKLWFFENEEQIELEIERKEVRYPKRWFGKKKKPRVVDEGYVPPEIQIKRSSNRSN